ncbi:haloacid dehalogenase-like hydrolase [Patulibacter sp. SYSU D01012]|uniref:HAD family hydrolase n=1 Tax=Patulibacter sp. SYSU D01012 TaxID=2817381 RepID=UPI001B30B2E4|nr:haloacid dehalogenase-like hydrolase [Patulibacter sp. SYSU D01012]
MTGSARPVAPAGAWLLLWDIDGTLLLKASGSHAAAVWDALRAVHGVEGDEMPKGQPLAGMTDGQIARDILTAAGIADEAIDAHADAVARLTCERYAPGDLQDRVSPGVDDVLAELHARPDVVQSLVTGNFELVARRKLQAAGLGDWFDPEIGGGFGSDHEEREHLPAFARRRAGAVLRADGRPWPVDRTIVIGDTPRDIACARHDGVRVVAVATGSHPADDLTGADAVAHDAAGLRRELLSIIEGAPAAPADSPEVPA